MPAAADCRWSCSPRTSCAGETCDPPERAHLVPQSSPGPAQEATVTALATGVAHRNSYVRRAAVLAGVGGLLFGYDTGVIGGALPLIANDFDWDTPFRKGVITSALLLGAALGAFLAGRLSDRLGRKRLILLTAATFVVGIAGASLAPDAATLVAFRVIIGLGVGSASVV